MSFTLNQVTQRAGGGNIVRTKKIETAEPVIGRGADCDIQIPDLAVSLRHAVMRQLGRGRIEVKALGQIGFEADGSFTKSAQLSLADRPRLIFGSHELNLVPGGEPEEIVVTLSRSDSAAAEPEVQDEKTVFRLASSMFSRRSAAWTLAAALLVLCLIVPVVVYGLYSNAPITAPTQTFPRADVQWESGHLSPGHRFLEGNCQACHQKPFVAVRDDACLACHRAGLAKQNALALAEQLRSAGSSAAPEPASDHAPFERLAKAQPMRSGAGANIHTAISQMFNHPDGRCESCHTEHVGPNKTSNVKTVTAAQIVRVDCAGCHAGLKQRLPDTMLLDAADWGDHPDFRPLIVTSPNGPRVERITLSGHPFENSGLTFPHALHLLKTGGVARQAIELGSVRHYGAPLDCANCHHADASGRFYQPVEMVRDCSSCHSLAYARVGGETMMLKHGDPKVVVAQLKDFYSSGGATAPDAGLFRRQPGVDAMLVPASGDAVARHVRAVFVPDRQSAFARGGVCYGCHAVVQPSDPSSLDFDIIRPHLTARYLPRGGFDHSVPAHRVDANGQPICSSCHKAESSKTSSDVLLPQIARCAACHGRSKRDTPMAAGATCTECHGYHQPGMPTVAVNIDWVAEAKSTAR